MNTLAQILNPFSEQVFSRVFVTTPTARASNVTEMMVDTAAVTATIFAPSPQPGFCFAVTDEATNAASNNITVDGNGQLIEGASTFVLDEDNESIVFVWDDSANEWRSAVYARQIVEAPIVFADDVAASASAFGPAQKVFTQDVVYIDPINGNDTHDALTPATAWKTNAQLQRAVGVWGIIRPVSGALDIFYLSPTPPEDPFTLLAEWDFITLHGARTVVASGSVTAKVDQDNATETPFQITDAAQVPAFWADKVRKKLYIPPQGPRVSEATSSVILDQGAATARTGEWSEDGGGIPQPAMGPQVGETYQVVDYLGLSLGPIGNSNPLGVLDFFEITIRPNAFDPTLSVGAFTPNGALGLGGFIFFYCRIDAILKLQPGQNAFVGASTVTAQIEAHGNLTGFWGVSVVPDPANVPGVFPGGVLVTADASVVLDGWTFQGDLPNQAFADVNFEGNGLALGQVGFLDTEHGIQTSALGGAVSLGVDGQLYSDATSMPWGGGNEFAIFTHANTSVYIGGGGPTFALPNIDNLDTPGLPFRFDHSSNDGIESQTVVSWDLATAGFVPPGGFPATWASLQVAQPAGGMFESGPGFKNASLNFPRSGTAITYEGF